MYRFAALLICVFCFVTAGLLSCGRNQKNPQAVFDRDTSGFGLRVLPECLQLEPAEQAASAEFSISSELAGAETVVSISVTGANGLKALYCDLAYDADTYTLLEASETGLLSQGGAGVRLASGTSFPGAPLELSVLKDRGLLHYGLLLPGWQYQSGFSGSGVLATVRFRPAQPGDRDPAPAAAQTATTAASRAPLRIFSGNQLIWWYASQGDCDENSEVNVADLTPIGGTFGQAGPFAMSSRLCCIDSDLNGEVNIADITPIGANFGRLVNGYRLYASASSGDYPASPDGPNGAGAVQLADLPFSSGILVAPAVRRAFSFSIPAPGAGDIYWVRPYDSAGEGIASEMIGPGLAGNQHPQAFLGAAPLSGSAPLTVNFDASSCLDPDANPLTFKWDLDGDGTLETDTGGTASSSFTYNTVGEFYPMLQIEDGLGGFDAVFVHISVNSGGGGNIPPNITGITITPNPMSSGGTALVHIVFEDPDNVAYSGSCTPDFGSVSLAPPTGIPLSLDFYYTAPVVGSDTVATLSCLIDDGTDTDSMDSGLLITAPSPGNSPPSVSAFGIAPDPLVGGDVGGLNITATDPDGDPMVVTWVHDGNNGNISGSGFSVDYNSYTVAAVANVTVTAYIDDQHGNVTVQPISFQVIPAGGNTAPSVTITPDVSGGLRPLHVNFSTSASDPDGDPLTYRWDMDDDGIYEIDTGAVSTLGHDFLLGMEYHAAVEVNDGQGHAAASSTIITVTPAWTATVLDPAIDSGVISSLIDRGGVPGVAYYYNDSLSVFQTQYLEALDPFGTGWSGGTIGPGGGDGLAAVFAGGVLGVGVYDTGLGGTPCLFDRCISPGVVSPATVDAGIGQGLHMMGADINGQPALCWCHMIDLSNYELRYARAIDASADNWAAATTVDSALGLQLGWRCSMAVVNGFPAIAYTDNTNRSVLFIRALDAAGSAWGVFQTAAIPPGILDYSGNCRLVDSGGFPAIFFVDQTNNVLFFKRSDDANGGAWTGSELNIAGSCSLDIDATTYVSGLPVCAFVASDTGALRYIELASTDGSVNSGSLDIDTSTICAAPSFREIGGYAAASYYDVTGQVLKYAVKY